MAEKLDLHSLRANRIQKARHMLHHSGYAEGGAVRPSGGEEGQKAAGPDNDMESVESRKRGGKVAGKASGKKSARRLDREPRAGGGRARKKRADGGEAGDDVIREMNSPMAPIPDKNDPEFTGEELDKIDSQATEKAKTEKPISQSFGPKEDNAIGMAAHSNHRGFMSQIGKGKSLEAARDAGDALGEHAYRQAGGDSAGSSWRKARAGETKKRGGRAR